MAARLVLVLVAASLLAAGPAAAQVDPDAAFPFDVPGGTVLVTAMPKQSKAVQQAVSQTLAFEEEGTALPLSAERCPTGRVVITAERKATMDKRWRQASREPKRLAGLFLWGSATQDCRIMLNARVLHAVDEAGICNLVEHELGHARGLEHTETGLMSPKLQLLPVPGSCDWAFSEYLDEE